MALSPEKRKEQIWSAIFGDFTPAEATELIHATDNRLALYRGGSVGRVSCK
jgi:hypothetical protein